MSEVTALDAGNSRASSSSLVLACILVKIQIKWRDGERGTAKELIGWTISGRKGRGRICGEVERVVRHPTMDFLFEVGPEAAGSGGRFASRTSNDSRANTQERVYVQ